MNLAQCLTKLSGLFSKEERAEIEAATAGKGDLVVLSMVAGMAADARYEEQRIVALIGEAQERATTVEQEPAPRATTVEQAKPDLDSRHQLNVDDKAGMDEVSDADADPLIKRLTSQQDNGDILKALPPRARQIVAAALNDLFRLGLPRHLFNDLSGIYMQETNGDGTYYWQRKGIGLHRRLLVEVASGDKFAARALRGVLAHELGHHVDEGPDHFYSSESPAFEIAVGSVSGERVAVGGIIREAFDAYLYGSKELRGYLSYPLYAWTTDPDVDRATQQIKMETFAQLQRLYYTNPRMMRAELPKSYQLFEEIHHAWQSEAGRRAPGLAVQQALRAPRTDGRAAVRAAGGNRPAHQGGAGVGRAGAGLGGAALGQRGAQGLAVEESRGGAVPQVRADRERGRPDQVTHSELRGDGRDFTAFFADATRGGRKPNTGRTYTPVLDIGHAADFSREYAQHRGNFDDHIATSIPGFREVQQAVGNAIAKAYAGGGRVLDVGASEGSFIKAISAVTGGKVETVGLDPNPAMAQFFAEHSQVPGSSYEMSAFGAQEDAGAVAWTEDDGTEIRYYSPSGKFDVVHEAMTFQFISNARAPQVARVKELLSPSGVALFEEKFIPPPAEFDVNEAKKDEYKARYYSQDELARKKKDVLERGQEAAAAAEQEKEAKVVGMHKLMVSPAEFEGVLADNFKHVIQYWDSGNFKGYAASDDANALRELVRQMGNLDSEYATVSTPRQVADAIRGRGKPDALNMAAGSRSDAKLSDFAPGRVGNIIKKKNWAILTAENPSARQLPAAMNAKRNARLEADLAAAGYEFEKVVGKYGGNDEHSYIVVGITPEQANALRDKYGQDASLTRNGLEHSDGSVTPAVGAVEHTTTPSDFFTRVPSTGSMFSVELDFDKRSAPTRVPAELTKVLTSDEIAVLGQGRGRVAKLIATMNELPPTADFKHAALAGRAARGWYRKSRLAVEAIFGADAPRFISLMAALSPQTDVRGNFYNAARVWHAWVRAGRTTDRERLQRIYDENLLTDAGLEDGKNAMTSWSGNATRALTTATPETTSLSGPKVESFRRNLLGHDNEVTNDRHNAAFGGISQEEFKGRKTKGDALSGKGPGYIAFSARVRQAARELSKEGDRWSPAEVQETLWSFWKALYDLATAKGETRSALQLLRDGALTHEMVRRVPHLGSFFNEQEYAQIARAGRRGDAATAGADRAGAYAEPGDALEAGPIAATPATERIARRADRLIAARARLEALKAEIKSQDAQLEEAGFSRDAEMRALEAEIARIEADAEGGTHAPSKPDALDAITAPDTPEFKRWFGDSKVVDESGRPLVVYHGGSFSAHSIPATPMWFTESKADAKGYAKSQHGALTSAYLAIKNPRTVGPHEETNRVLNGMQALIRHGYDGVHDPSVGDWIPFRPEQIKSATGNVGNFDPAKPSILDAREPTPLWYSALSRAVEQAPFSKAGTMPAGQLRMWLAANAAKLGVKKDEIEWSGINDWLALAADAPDKQYRNVSREDVTSFLDQNGVKVEETLLGERQLPPGVHMRVEDGENGEERFAIAGSNATGYGSTPAEAAIALSQRFETLARHWQRNGDEGAARRYFIRAEGMNEWAESAAGYGSGKETKFSGWQLPGGKNYKEIAIVLPGSKYGYRVPDAHRMGPGADIDRVVHIRFNERTDAEGKRVLFIEEIQSDWAQSGRKEGFNLRPKKTANADGTVTVDYGNGQRRTFRDEASADGSIRTATTPIQGSSVPPAPFVNKTEAWVALALKRMIRYAVDNDFDAVAWTTGEQQAARYDLSKQVSRIRVELLENGKYEVAAWKDKDRVLTEVADAKELPNYIGKELAEKAINNISEGGPKFTGFSGLDLKVGGEGMRAFYEKIVPNVANDILKKFGGGKVGSVNVDAHEYGVDNNDSGKWRIYDHGAGRYLDGAYPTEAAATAAMVNLPDGAQPGFYIDDSMRGAASKPMALFAHEGGGSGAFTVYRGQSGAFDKNAILSAEDGASWFTSDEGHAASFGDVSRYRVTMRNPMVISEDDLDAAWDEEHPDGNQDGRNLLPRDFVKQFVARAKAAGNDGLIIKDMGDRDAVADMYLPFVPANIEAAPYGKPDALDFSAGSGRSLVTHAVSDLLTTSKSFNLWDRTVGTQYHKAHKASADPMFKRVYDGVQRFMNDASQLMMDASELAPDILPRLDKLRDVFRLGPNKADMRQVADAVFDGTINDVVYSDADLRGRGLTDHQIGLYRQARAAIDKSLTDMTTSEAIKEARGLLPDAVLAQARDAGNPWIVVDGLANIPQKTAVQQQVYDQLRKRVAKIEDMKRQGYAPLQRFGRYTVTVQNSDGSTALFTLHESEREANAFARSVGETLQPGQGVSQGVLSQEAWKVFQGVSPDTLEIFADALGASDKELMQEYLKLAVNNRSVLKRMIQRKKIPGFQDDIQRTLAQFITSNSRAASRNYHWGDILKDTQLIPKERGDVKDEAIRLTQYVQEPGEEAGALRGLLFVQFLGGSIASAVTNATQPVMMTFPWLAQYGGAIKAAARLTEAGAVAAGKTPAEPALQAALARATKEGIVDPHEVAGLYAESIRNFGAKPAVRRALKVWGSLFSLAEAFNRRITFVAAYRTAVAESIADPYDFAVRAIAETQGVYNRGNRPNWARGAVGATLFTFKQYSIAYMEFLARLPRKERALALAVLVLAAGLQGLPGADDLEDVIDTIAESLGYSFNSKKQLREWAASTLGNESWANFAVHGFSGIPGVPLDMQARLGLQNLIPGTAILKRSETDKSRDVLEFFGPAGSQLKSTVEAFTAAQAGDKGAVARSLVPMAVRNAMKGMDMAQTGFYRDDQGRRVIDVAAYEAAIKAIGFQPRRVAEQSRVVQDAQQDINLHRDVEARLVGKMARAIVEHDEDSLQQARAELVAWNRRNPGSIIQITPQQVRQRAQKMMQTREVRFIKSAPRELRGHIAEELRG